ncbi:serine hydrolase domain-containing protein [Microvirga sp. GCM10011540]|uniref:serine hydrolase domain-containing protein n=1 Tax=Microvirga sp. GCM10011540 TaxID=3317338 RepID=UPI003623C660
MEAWAVVENGVVTGSHDAGQMVPWWSFTKTVLAAGALVLVRDGLASLDEPLPGKPYTLRQLLQHRSGLGNYGGVAAYHDAVAKGEEPWPVTMLLDRVEAERLRYRPGEGWEYSNIGYLFVRRFIETLSGEDMDGALRRLVLRPLGIERARVARDRSDLAGVVMGEAHSYHPGWVYHGLLVGPAEEAAILLDDLLRGVLLPPDLLAEMLRVFPLQGPIPGRPWQIPGYGLGLTSGETTAGGRVAGHTGGGPGSTIAVYGDLSARPLRTAAFFATDEDQAKTEAGAFRLLGV